MKFFFRTLPTFLLLLVVWALSAQAQQPAPVSGTSTGQEIQTLRQELKQAAAWLDKLEGGSHHVVPRGGLTANGPAAPPTLAAADAPPPSPFRGTM